MMRRFRTLLGFMLLLPMAAQIPAHAQAPDGLRLRVGQVRIVAATPSSDEGIAVRFRVSCSGDHAFGDHWLVQVAQRDGEFYDVVLGGAETPGLGCPHNAWITAIVPTHGLIEPGDGLTHFFNYDTGACPPRDPCEQIERFAVNNIPVRIKPAH